MRISVTKWDLKWEWMLVEMWPGSKSLFTALLRILSFSLSFFFIIIFSFLNVKRYAQFDPSAVVDGRARGLKFEVVNQFVVSAIIPHFWTDAGTF